MPKYFESISDGFYTAFLQPDPDKRREAMEAWLGEGIKVVKLNAEKELRDLIEHVLENGSTEEKWKGMAKKYSDPEFIDRYKFCLEINIRQIPNDKGGNKFNQKFDIVDPLTQEVRARTLEAAKSAKLAIARLEPPSPVALKEIDLHNDYKVEVAITNLEKFLEESYTNNVRRVRIIHGKGIFVLQKAVREHLKKHMFVIPQSIKAAEKDHGGEGATEANLVEWNRDLLKV